MPKNTNPLLRRSSSGPFSLAQRRKPSVNRNVDKDQRLDDNGSVPALAPARVSQTVINLIQHANSACFAEIPDRAAGMNSERISEVLRFRAGLPPIVSLAHLFALSASSTATERELAKLLAMGRVRKIVIPGRGKGGAAVGEGVVIVEEWKRRVEEDAALDREVKDKYLLLLAAHPTSTTTPTTSLSDLELRQLVTAGYLTSPTALSATPSLFRTDSISTISSLPFLSTAGSRAATGTLAAVGGASAIQDSGGGGSMLAASDTRPDRNARADALVRREMTFSLPGTGAYLKLVVSARQQLLALLRQLSPRHKEATMDLLREKWDGNTALDSIGAKAGKGVLPGRTRRWREFYGMEFAFVLGECVGGGLMELFDTGSVGLAVRAR